MNGRWLSREELLALTGYNLRTVQRKVQERSLKTRAVRRSNARPIREYSLDSLPYEFQVKAEQQRSALAKETALALPQPPTVQETPATPPPVKVAFASLEQEAQARERYAIIEPLVRFQPGPRLASPGQLQLALAMVLPDGSPVTTRTQMRRYLANKHNLSDITIYRWVRAFTKHGLVGLADQARSDRGDSRFFKKHPDAATLAAYLYLGQRQSARAAFEAIQRDCLLLKLKPCELPSYETVRAFLKRTPEPLKLLARKGARVYSERCSPYLSRTRVNVSAGEIWVGDHMTHDFFAQNDTFVDAEWGARIRLRFTAFADFRSNMFLGYSWAWEGSSHSIATALRRGVERYGPPESAYVDNGKDYLKVARGAMPAYLRESGISPVDWWKTEYDDMTKLGVFAMMGIAVQHCIVRHPQSKAVERLFGTVHSGFDKIFPTYSGCSPATRPDFATEALAEHRKLLRVGQPGMSKLPWTSDVIRMAIAWIEEVYHNKPQKSRDMEGMSPRQAFAAFRNPNQRPAPTPEVLALMLAEHKSVAVRECQFVLHKHAYIGDDEISATMLHQQNDRQVTVAYDPLDAEKVAVLDDNGRLIAWARRKEFVTQSADSGPAIAESMQLRRRLKKQTAGTIVAIAEAARANGAMTEAEHLAQRAGVMEANGAITQRRPRLRPDNTAVAPLSACEIARQVLAIGEKK